MGEIKKSGKNYTNILIKEFEKRSDVTKPKSSKSPLSRDRRYHKRGYSGPKF